MMGLSKNTSLKIVLCLAATCFFAAVILGGVFYLTEPLKLRNKMTREKELIQKLLDIGDGAEVVEVRRYLSATSETVAYLLSDALLEYDTRGNLVTITSKPPSLKEASAEEWDRWVQTVSESHFVGRFFIAKNSAGKEVGYVTESSQYGFKNLIHFFVALTPDFQIRGVEVVFHEEDPGLGAEIVKPTFKNQFVGLTLSDLSSLKVVKGPRPHEIAQGEKIIYAVTGATISSKALVDGVKQAVLHLNQRLNILHTTRGTP